MQNRIVAGIACLCLGVLVFSTQDPLIKAVSDRYPVMEVMAIRCVVALPIMLLLVHRDVGLGALVSRNFGLLSLRALTLFASYTAYYLALAALPLADAVALYFMAPLFIMVLSGPYLGERVSWQSFATVSVGLVGVLVMLRPGGGMFEWAALLSLLSAGLYGFAQMTARKLGATESSTVMSFYQNGVYLLGAIVTALVFMVVDVGHITHPSLRFLTRGWEWPTTGDFLMMASCGVIASAGMTLLSQAYRLAPANIVATFEYTGILWAPLWGFLFFAEVPHTSTVLGGVLIVGAGLFALNARQSEKVPA
ncbi:drug/metabolite transporter (DMT)-like permease [Mesorhizobium soli]|jgi:drug/metabolite transporter (DMT)-like permease|uniref:DMT family transporter n=1 Tax=Pseudaminobacter soli (ex Li et al. 2025) TaxID=1295366 RepID=UPI0024757800|nr:DMT family transporter [Mesorhizobium soli]MDH6234075.1 drug/metabolite transporter (DMT)-like permease [Mesorhizobium soli]